MGRLAAQEDTLSAGYRMLLAHMETLDAQSQRDPLALFEAYQAAFEADVSHGHFALVASLIETTPRADVRGLLVGAFAGLWARHAPDVAARWLRRVSPEPLQSAPIMAEVMGTWAVRDPQAAAAFAESLESSPLRSTALASVVAQWAARDMAAAGEWLAAQNVNRDFDPAIVALLRDPAWDRHASAAAMRLAETLSDTDLRLEAMADIARRWLAQDAMSARRYLANSAYVLAHADRFSTALSARKDLGDE